MRERRGGCEAGDDANWKVADFLDSAVDGGIPPLEMFSSIERSYFSYLILFYIFIE